MRANEEEDAEWLKYLEKFNAEYDDRVYSNQTTGLIMRASHMACESPFGRQQN